jgi:hypothetical protein
VDPKLAEQSLGRFTLCPWPRRTKMRGRPSATQRQVLHGAERRDQTEILMYEVDSVARVVDGSRRPVDVDNDL